MYGIIKVVQKLNIEKKGIKKMMIKEKITMNKELLREACINNRWYTRGSNDSYEKMFKLSEKNCTKKIIYELAKDIYDHSNKEESFFFYNETENETISRIMNIIFLCTDVRFEVK